VVGLSDPTGAGDSFAGGFIGRLAQSGRLDGPARRNALACGAAMASLAIEAFSPRRLVDSGVEEIRERVEMLHRMARFDLEA
jgi:sugar/nucleoside kinase (ribokinase family)